MEGGVAPPPPPPGDRTDAVALLLEVAPQLTWERAAALLRECGGDLSSALVVAEAETAEAAAGAEQQAAGGERRRASGAAEPLLPPPSSRRQPGRFSQFVTSLLQRLWTWVAVFPRFFLGLALPPPRPELNEYFTRRFGPGVARFFDGSFAEAADRAARTRKPLLVYAHDDAEAPAAAAVPPSFFTAVFRNPAFVAAANADCVLYGFLPSHWEGAPVLRRILRSGPVPQVAVFVVQDGGDASSSGPLLGPQAAAGQPRLQLVGAVDAPDVHAVMRLMQQARSRLDEGGRSRRRWDQDRELRAQQDREYENSLKKDAEREAAAARERDEALAQAAREAAAREAAAAAEAAEWARALGALAELRTPAAGAGGAPLLTIRVRMPSGQLLQRPFPPGARVAAARDWLAALRPLLRRTGGDFAAAVALLAAADGWDAGGAGRACGEAASGAPVEIPEKFVLTAALPPRALAPDDVLAAAAGGGSSAALLFLRPAAAAGTSGAEKTEPLLGNRCREQETERG